jgi:predicted phosphodiesterase
MRLAILSDIHSNLVALEAVLADIGSVDGIRVLGDVVGYGPEPDAVVDLLRETGAIGVRGNHDSAAIGGGEIEWFNPDARAAIEWTRDRIGPTTRDWLAALPERIEEDLFTLVHGSPRDPTWEYIIDQDVAAQNLDAFETAHCLFGHTHLPVAFRHSSGGMQTVTPQDGDILDLDARRTLLNPGSVGQPRDGITLAAWLLLDTDGPTASWHRTEYDIAATQASMRAAGLPARLVARLERGA